jgi:hypothetical protein
MVAGLTAEQRRRLAEMLKGAGGEGTGPVGA